MTLRDEISWPLMVGVPTFVYGFIFDPDYGTYIKNPVSVRGVECAMLFASGFDLP